jgi:hypothetical protein
MDLTLGGSGGTASNLPVPAACQRPGVDTRQPRMEGVTPTHFILKRTTQKRKGGARVLRRLCEEEKKLGANGGPAHAW